MPTANSDVRWIRVFDRSGRLVEVPDTTMPCNVAESIQISTNTANKPK